MFSFPPAGHNCFTTTGSVTCMFCQHEASRVFVKLADLGVSALAGPAGFHRKAATPGHSAPEAIEYAGTEPLSEKVCSGCLYFMIQYKTSQVLVYWNISVYDTLLGRISK